MIIMHYVRPFFVYLCLALFANGNVNGMGELKKLQNTAIQYYLGQISQNELPKLLFEFSEDPVFSNINRCPVQNECRIAWQQNLAAYISGPKTLEDHISLARNQRYPFDLLHPILKLVLNGNARHKVSNILLSPSDKKSNQKRAFTKNPNP